jgi:hypothetical protein
MKAGAVLALALFASTAGAGVPVTLDLTCAEVRQMVAINGVVNLNTGGKYYQRYVTDARWCFDDQLVEVAYVPTSDKERCRAGMICIDRF